MSDVDVKCNIIIKIGDNEFVTTEAEAKELQAKLNALFPHTNPYWWYPTTTDGTGVKP